MKDNDSDKKFSAFICGVILMRETEETCIKMDSNKCVSYAK